MASDEWVTIGRGDEWQDADEWEDLPPARAEAPSMVGSALRTVRDVGVGALKGAGTTLTSFYELESALVDKLSGGRAQFPQGGVAPTKAALRRTNTAQEVGALGEQIAEIAYSGAPKFAAAGIARLPGVGRLAGKAVLRLAPAVLRDAVIAAGSAQLHDQDPRTAAILGGALPIVAAGGSRGAALLGVAGQKVAGSPVLQRRIADVIAPSVGLGVGGPAGAAVGYLARGAVRSAMVPVVRTGARVAARSMPAVARTLDAVVDAGRAVPVRGARPVVATTPVPAAARSAAGAVPEAAAAEQLPLLDARMIDRGRSLEVVSAPSSIHDQLVEELMKREALRPSPALPKLSKADIERITILDRQLGSQDTARALRHDPRFKGMSAAERSAAIKGISTEQAGTLPERARVVYDNIWAGLKTRQDQIEYLAAQGNPAVKLHLSSKPLKSR